MIRVFIPALVVLLLGGAGPSLAQDPATKRLEDSPRHHEWIEVKSGERAVHCFVAFPEKKESTPVVLVIHENRGLTDWVRSFADQIAEAGYLAIAPDLLSGFDADHDRTSAFATSDEARNALYRLDAEQITRDLLAVQKHVAGMPASSGKIVVSGFCWGGGQSFAFATHARGLSAALVFYGSSPSGEELATIDCPVHGFYAENDQRINSGLEATAARMKELGKTFDLVTYTGAGHAFMRRGEEADASPENRKARDDAWKRIATILSVIR
jgi:carboxymethylenebutenolidase